MTLFYSIRGVRKFCLIYQNLIFNYLFRNRLQQRIKIFGFPRVFLAPGSSIENGDNLVLISSSYFNNAAISHPVTIRLLNKNSRLIIGNDVGISGGGISVETEVKIGNGVMLGANVFITDTDFHPINHQNRRFANAHVNTSPVLIEDNVFIGMNTIVLKGVEIGKNSVVGAGSIVSRSIPADSIAAGNPAVVLRRL